MFGNNTIGLFGFLFPLKAIDPINPVNPVQYENYNSAPCEFINIAWAYYPYRDKNSSCFDLLKIIIRETILMTPVIISTCDIFFFDLEIWSIFYPSIH